MGKPDYLNHQKLAYFQNNTLILDSLNISNHSVDFFQIVNLE
jgi:hypothetical protein